MNNIFLETQDPETRYCEELERQYMEQNKLKQAFDLLIGYYTASIDIITQILSPNETMPKTVIKRRINNDEKVLEILKEDYEIIFGGEEE